VNELWNLALRCHPIGRTKDGHCERNWLHDAWKKVFGCDCYERANRQIWGPLTEDVTMKIRLLLSRNTDWFV
jgi:hypothetical protein